MKYVLKDENKEPEILLFLEYGDLGTIDLVAKKRGSDESQVLMEFHIDGSFYKLGLNKEVAKRMGFQLDEDGTILEVE